MTEPELMIALQYSIARMLFGFFIISKLFPVISSAASCRTAGYDKEGFFSSSLCSTSLNNGEIRILAHSIKCSESSFSAPNTRVSTPGILFKIDMPAAAKPSADIIENGKGSSNTRLAPHSAAHLARVYLSATATSAR
ncbi:hypothetical protein SDC9_182169 [bioreactor metagenome]|uniref:Uncharacterized protein n=1 Tax=bioreactor metagenome TaxID=1076179 RepID=A0A645H6R1_9ZZZZ